MTTVSAYIINPAFLRLMCCLLNFLIAFCTLSCLCLPSGPFQATTFFDCMATSCTTQCTFMCEPRVTWSGCRPRLSLASQSQSASRCGGRH